MSDYIKRDAAKETMARFLGYGTIDEDMVCRFKIALDGIAAADVRPVARGKWINKNSVFVTYGSAECSVCGERTSGSKVDTGWGVDFEYPNFCPNCGAEMKCDS